MTAIGLITADGTGCSDKHERVGDGGEPDGSPDAERPPVADGAVTKDAAADGAVTEDAAVDGAVTEDAAVGPDCSASAHVLLDCEGIVPMEKLRPEPVELPRCGDAVVGAPSGSQVIRDRECLEQVVSYVCSGYLQDAEYLTIDFDTDIVVLLVSPYVCEGTINVSQVELCGGVQHVESTHVLPFDPKCESGCDGAPWGRLLMVPKARDVAVNETGPCTN